KLAVGDLDVITCRPADLIPEELDKLRGEVEGLAKSDEDVLTYAMFPELGRTFLQERAAGTLTPEPLLPPQAKHTGERPTQYAPNEFRITLHGETYHVRVTGTGRRDEDKRPFYVHVDGVAEEVLVETLSEIEVTPGAEISRKAGPAASPTSARQRPKPSRPGHVTTAMPGTIVDVLVKTGQKVNAGDGVLVIEAMKMENEIQAPVAGTVIAIFVAKGDAVTPDQVLVEIQPE
ncbi:MAG: biotin/lipoyl-containing protein, partial [Thiobacillaceae bacterium]